MTIFVIDGNVVNLLDWRNHAWSHVFNFDLGARETECVKGAFGTHEERMLRTVFFEVIDEEFHPMVGPHPKVETCRSRALPWFQPFNLELRVSGRTELCYPLSQLVRDPAVGVGFVLPAMIHIGGSEKWELHIIPMDPRPEAREGVMRKRFTLLVSFDGIVKKTRA